MKSSQIVSVLLLIACDTVEQTLLRSFSFPDPIEESDE
jgi:hypothetical protein